MQQAVDAFIKRQQLLAGGETVIVAVSGGPDSMALLDYLARVRQRWALTLMAASVDHGLRGEESAADLHYVESWCKERNIPVDGTHVDVAAFQKDHDLGVQEAARACRYRFFAEMMRRQKADKLVLAHHGDDQIETMLMRQVRGSMGEGRSGIPVRRDFAGGEIIRPLLAVDKQQIEVYCRKQGIQPRRDPSNQSDHYTRNRFRHHILPFLKEENPNVHHRFQQDSQMLQEDHRYLQQLAKERMKDVILSKEPQAEIVLSIPAFLAVPIALQRRMIHLVLNYLYGQIPVSLSSVHMNDILDILDRHKPSGELDFPEGLRVIRSYERLWFTYQKREAGICTYEYNLPVPGHRTIPGGTLTAKLATDQLEDVDDRYVFVCDADLVRFPLTVRNRRPGDRLRPAGMKGTKKVKAIFIEQKVDRQKRAIWPLVMDANENMLWLPGLKHSDYAAVTDQTKRFLILRFDGVISEESFGNEGRYPRNTNKPGGDRG